MIYMLDTKRSRLRRIWGEGNLESTVSVGISDLIATRLGGVAWIAVRGETGGAGTFRSRVFKANAGANLELHVRYVITRTLVGPLTASLGRCRPAPTLGR